MLGNSKKVNYNTEGQNPVQNILILGWSCIQELYQEYTSKGCYYKSNSIDAEGVVARYGRNKNHQADVYSNTQTFHQCIMLHGNGEYLVGFSF